MEYIAIFGSLISAIIAWVFKRNSPKYVSAITILFMLLATISAIYLFLDIYHNTKIKHIVLANWIHSHGFHINWSLYLDELSLIMIAMINAVSLLVHLYSIGYMSQDKNLGLFMSYLSLFTFFMLILVASDNFLQLFFGWEGVGLCSYLLIGFWYHKDSASNAAIKAFVVNRISDCAMIIGILLIYLFFRTLEFKEIFQMVAAMVGKNFSALFFELNIVDLICILLLIGAMGKSAQIGLHVWLADAMEGPTPVSALIHAATMVTAGVFLIARCSYIFEHSVIALNAITVVGAITAFMAATIAIAQTDIKKIIAYSTCSQLGYMFVALGLSSYHAGVFHLLTHAFFKGLLFLSAGSVIHAMSGEQDIEKMGGLWRKTPITFSAFIIGTLAIIGILPFSGYYSKDLIIHAAYFEESLVSTYAFWLLMFSSFMTGAYSTRLMYKVFFGTGSHLSSNAHESPLSMTIPLIVLALFATFAGMYGYYVLGFKDFSNFLLNSSILIRHFTDHQEATFFISTIMPMIPGILGAILAFLAIKYKDFARLMVIKHLNILLANKYYFDEIYNVLFVRTLHMKAHIFSFVDKNIIDKCGPLAIAGIARTISRYVSCLHSGYIFHYIIYILSGIACLIGFIMSLNISSLSTIISF